VLLKSVLDRTAAEGKTSNLRHKLNSETSEHQVGGKLSQVSNGLFHNPKQTAVQELRFSKDGGVVGMQFWTD
jgi:hypothetical protein